MKQPESYINFEVYEDAKRFCGVANVTLPNIQFIVQSIEGAGIAGKIDAVIPGMMEAMTTSINFRSYTDDAINLSAPKMHSVDLRIAESVGDNITGEKDVIADKYVLDLMPKNTNLGSAAPATPGDVSGEYATHILKGYREGKQVLDIEPYNYKCVINGVDYLEKVRTALGL